MTYEQIVILFNQDTKYARYLAKRFLVPYSLDEIAITEGLPAGTFHRLFVDFPEYEQLFKKMVEEEDDGAKELFIRQASTNALQKLADIISNPEDAENKDLIQACKAMLSYRPISKKMGEKSPLDSIFADLLEKEHGE